MRCPSALLPALSPLLLPVILAAAFVCGPAGIARAQDGSRQTGDAASRRHSVVLFVADGLRPGMIRADIAPTMAALKERGVSFTNTHSMFPTFTMANGSAMATGHYLGDTGIFSNTLSSGFPVASAKGSVTPFIENDAVLGDLDGHYSADFITERTVLAAARMAGLGTAAIGKLGPTLLQD